MTFPDSPAGRGTSGEVALDNLPLHRYTYLWRGFFMESGNWVCWGLLGVLVWLSAMILHNGWMLRAIADRTAQLIAVELEKRGAVVDPQRIEKEKFSGT